MVAEIAQFTTAEENARKYTKHKIIQKTLSSLQQHVLQVADNNVGCTQQKQSIVV